MRLMEVVQPTMILAALVAGIAAMAKAAVVSERFGPGSLAGLENDLSYERRENEAIARLYENVLDVLQVRAHMLAVLHPLCE